MSGQSRFHGSLLASYDDTNSKNEGTRYINPITPQKTWHHDTITLARYLWMGGVPAYKRLVYKIIGKVKI